jgi:DNA-binding NarL/FixJ family response regulator
MKLLIVDDHAGVRKLIREMLATLATEIRECVNGAEAITAYGEFKPDFVIMDLHMPEVGGFEATCRIVEKHPRARVIAISNLKHPGMGSLAQRAGARHFVQKDNLDQLPPYLIREYPKGIDN